MSADLRKLLKRAIDHIEHPGVKWETEGFIRACKTALSEPVPESVIWHCPNCGMSDCSAPPPASPSAVEYVGQCDCGKQVRLRAPAVPLSLTLPSPSDARAAVRLTDEQIKQLAKESGLLPGLLDERPTIEELERILQQPDGTYEVRLNADGSVTAYLKDVVQTFARAIEAAIEREGGI